MWPLLYLTFGGMGLLPCVAVARVFALVMRCRVMRLLVYSRVGKNRDTKRESPAGAGAARGANHKLFLFSYTFVAPRKAMTYTDLLGGRGTYCCQLNRYANNYLVLESCAIERTNEIIVNIIAIIPSELPRLGFDQRLW
jgi:hypothetical protein